MYSLEIFSLHWCPKILRKNPVHIFYIRKPQQLLFFCQLAWLFCNGILAFMRVEIWLVVVTSHISFLSHGTCLCHMRVCNMRILMIRDGRGSWMGLKHPDPIYASPCSITNSKEEKWSKAEGILDVWSHQVIFRRVIFGQAGSMRGYWPDTG